MSNDQNIENMDSQVPTASEPATTSPQAPEAPASPSTPEVVNNTTHENTENKAEMGEIPFEPANLPANPASNGTSLENNTETNETPENPEIPATEPVSTGTAQIPPNEPLKTEPEPIKSEPAPISIIVPERNKAKELLIKARNAIQFRKRKKLDKIMGLFLKKYKITNDEVEKLLHVSDATATRYLSILEKENKIKQTGKTGHAVSYTKI